MVFYSNVLVEESDSFLKLGAIISDPSPSEKHTVEELKAYGLVGVYFDSEESLRNFTKYRFGA